MTSFSGNTTTTTFPQTAYTTTYGSTFTAPTATVKCDTMTITSPAATYASSDTAVATVNSSTGAVTITGGGTVTITATYAGNSTYARSAATYTLTVSKGATTTTFPQSSYRVELGETFTAPTASVYSGSTSITSPAVTYTSSNTAVATVNSTSGVVTLMAVGSTTITARYPGDNNYQASSASYELGVTSASGIRFISPTEALRGIDTTLTLTPVISDSRIKADDLTWSSSDAVIATVSASGVVTSKNYGTVTITCKYQDLMEDSCRLTIYKEGLIYVGNIFYGISEDATYAYVTNCAGGKPLDERIREEYSGTVNIPATVTYDGMNFPVKAVGPYAFFNMKELQAVVVPASVQSFEYRSFEKSANLGRVAFLSKDAGLLSVGERAFYECTGLNNVSLPNSTLRIDKEGFRYCKGLSKISFGRSLNYINEYAMADCPMLNNVTLPESLKSIQIAGFRGDSALTAITYPEALEGIGASAFSNCTSLRDVTFNTSIYTLTIGEDAYLGSNAVSRVLVKNLDAWVSINFSNPAANPASIARHLYHADGEEIIDAVVPEGAIYVNNNVFYNCASIQSITLPATIQFVNDNTIYGCTSLTKMVCNTTDVPTFLGVLDPSVMNDVFGATTLYVPAAALGDYKADSWWMRFGNIGESGTEGNPDEDDIAEAGRYYLYNAEAGMYLTAGNNWGTRASLDAVGLELDIQPCGEGYSIDTQVSNGGDSHYLNIDGLAYCDQPAGSWQIKMQADGTYTLTLDGSSFLAYDGTTALVFTDDADGRSTRWRLVRKEERLAELRQATANSPKDATFLIPGANFSRNDQRNLTWNGNPTVGGMVENMCGEKFDMTFDVSQTLTDIPNGRYRVSFQGFYREGGHGPAINEALRQSGEEHLYASFYANQNAAPLMSIFEEAGRVEDAGRESSYGKVPDTMSDASAFFSQGLYERGVEVVVTGGTLRLGFCKDIYVENDWTCFDNVRLSYCGEATIVPGDINGDGKLTAEDVAALIRICLGKTLPGYVEGYGDLNGDGQVTLADVTILTDMLRNQ